MLQSTPIPSRHSHGRMQVEAVKVRLQRAACRQRRGVAIAAEPHYGDPARGPVVTRPMTAAP